MLITPPGDVWLSVQSTLFLLLIKLRKNVSTNALLRYLEMRMAEHVVLSVLLLHSITIVITRIKDASKVHIDLSLDCTFPRFADKFSQSCATTCQFGYFKNIAEHTC